MWWIANLIQVGPLELILLPWAIICLRTTFSPAPKKYVLAVFSSLVILLWGVIGMKTNFPPKNPPVPTLKIITVNLGQIKDFAALGEYIQSVNPDIVTFQELNWQTDNTWQRIFKGQGWSFHSHSQMGIASRYKISNVELKDRHDLGIGWLVFAFKYTLNGPMGPIQYFNIHLETPREGVAPLIHGDLNGFADLKNVTTQQALESAISSAWATSQSNTILSGDFNLRDTNPIFQTFWSKFSDAFSKSGFGLGWTIRFRWYGIRIDHILFDKNWRSVRCEVGPDVGSDHRPVMAELQYVGPAPSAPAAPLFSATKATDEKNHSWIFDDFTSSAGHFADGIEAELSIDQGSLKIQSKPLLSHVSAGLKTDAWNLGYAPRVRFSYKIPAGTPLVARVKTEFEDWICIAGTHPDACPDVPAGELARLIDDDAWHEASLDVRSSVGSVLSRVKYLKEFQLHTPQIKSFTETFWIDDFRIDRDMDGGNQNK